jgi:predicted glycosyltransferase
LITGRKKSVMIYVQHLLGIGHFRRALFLAQALVEKGFEVDLVSGGMPVSNLKLTNVKLHQLPPLRSLDSSFIRLLDQSGKPISDDYRQQRSNRLLELFDLISPDAVITETYPFGRRMMRFELLPLLNAIRQRSKPPLLIASIRDILQPKTKANREQEMVELVDRYYDRILVHGDESMATLADTFSLASELAQKTFYTGYICEPARDITADNTGKNEVLVSGGGGVVSLQLLTTALEAKPLSRLDQKTWRLLAGFNIDENSFNQLRNQAGNGIIVERNRSDFQALLRQCAVSVSQAGYNTTMDILGSGARAVMVPFADAGELEQTIRARLLQQHGRVIALDEKNLTANSLARAVNLASEMPKLSMKLKMDGANVSADLLQDWLYA